MIYFLIGAVLVILGLWLLKRRSEENTEYRISEQGVSRLKKLEAESTKRHQGISQGKKKKL